ncbi:hypothetical protein L7F22_065553 [Adiantum nelumboides]|nr:hypothetical protein [Adiantum nelumboides]
MHICSDLQHIVGKYGKKNAAFRRGKCKSAQEKIEQFTQLAKITELCEEQLVELQQARDVLKQDDLEMATKCRFLCRVHALQDYNDVSKGFFNKLKAKRKRDLLHCLQIENDTEISSPRDIMQYCENFYSKLLSEKKAQLASKDIAMKELLDNVDPCIEQIDARRLEAPFEETQVKYALSKLDNEKTPGICGISKEFVVAFWNDLKDIILSLLNSSWSPPLLNPLSRLVPHEAVRFASDEASWLIPSFDTVHYDCPKFHVNVHCQFISVEKRKEAKLLLALDTANIILRAHVRPNLTHEIYMFQKFGITNKERILERLTIEQRKWAEMEMGVETRLYHGVAPWYNTPCALIAQLVWKDDFNAHITKETAKIKGLGSSEQEVGKRLDKTIRAEEEQLKDKGYKYLAIANPSNDEELFAFLFGIRWDDDSMMQITKDKLYTLCSSKIP